MHTASAKNILVTGTNSGFGRLTALALAARGHHVYATMRDVAGRNAEAAQALAAAAADLPGTIDVVEMSLTSQESVDAGVQAALAKAGHLDVVVNNAGAATMGLCETLTDAQVLAQFDVNVVAPHRVLRAVLPGMRERRSGLVVHVTSTLGRYIIPAMGIYCVSKHALEALADAYNNELRPLGIETVVIQPGAYPTNIGANMSVGADQARAPGYGQMAGVVEMMGKALSEMFSGENVPNPQDVADAIVGVVDAEGPRPDRVTVDRNGADVSGVNEAHRALQKGALAAMGMG
ncbi:MAG: SDR family oxidoreductase [Nannocystaceae bacterium]